MADNTTLNTGSGGDTIASDDISGVKYPRSKIVIGADGTNDGDVSSANPLPVTGTVTANLSATDNAVLDAIAASVAGTLTVGSHAVTNAGTFAVQVSSAPTTAVTGPLTDAELRATAVPVSGTVTANLSATDNAVLDAIAASAELIDNAISGAGFNITQFAGAAVPIGAGLEATAVRVTLPTDGTGKVLAAQSGTWTVAGSGTFTIAGAVTNAGTFVTQIDGTALTRLTDIKTNTDSLAVVGNGAAATAQRVTLANDSTGIVALTTSTASIGKLAANSGIDIGDVDVTSVIPGTGAASLGKAIGATPGPTDTGVAMLGHIEESVAASGSSNNTYEHLSLTTHRELRTSDKRTLDLQSCNDYTQVAALGNDTLNLANSLDHVFGTGALTFDKVNGAANTIFAGVDDSFTVINIQELFETGCYVALACKLSSIADVAYVFCRIGTDSSNYNEWRWTAGDLAAGSWLSLRQATNKPKAYLGNGWSTSAVSYVAFGVAFNSETNTLTGILFDNVHLVTGTLTQSDINASVTSSVSSPNVRIAGYTGSTDVNSGVASANTLRVVEAGPAHDAADSGNPIKIGARAVTSVSAQTLVAANDRTDLLAGLDGVPITRLHANLEDIVTATPVAITDGSSTSVLASPGAGLKNCITSVAIANSSASFVTVDLRDGTAGAVLWTFPVPATGGVVYTFPMPLRCSAATALAADPSAAASTITVSVIGFKSKV